MTTFIPPEPGLYWARARDGAPYIVDVVDRGPWGLRGVLAKGHPADHWPLTMADFIAPVTLPNMVDAMTARIAEIEARSVSATVKPLVWKTVADGIDQADSPLGRIQIITAADGVILDIPGPDRRNHLYRTDSMAAAQAFAQHEVESALAPFLAALTPPLEPASQEE